MSRSRLLLKRILAGRSDANLRFDDLRVLLRELGFIERVRGSLHIFRREAKPYQVRQVGRVILKYGLKVNE